MVDGGTIMVDGGATMVGGAAMNATDIWNATRDSGQNEFGGSQLDSITSA